MKLYVGAKGLIHYKRKILLVRESSQYEDGTEAGKWDVPGGRIEPEETLIEGLEREVKEESGLNVEADTLLGVFDGFPEIGGEKVHVVRIYFLCEAESDQVILSSDHDIYEWVDPKKPGNRAFMDDIEEMLFKTTSLLRS